jgi:hypothetical protein
VQNGNSQAIQEWNRLIAVRDALTAQRDARQKNVNTIRAETGAVTQGVRDKRRELAATQDLTGLYGKLPKRVVTKVDQTGIVPTVRGIAQVAKRYNLLPKQIKSIIGVLGVDTTVKQVEKVKKHLQETGKTKVDLSTFGRSIDDQMARFRQDATTGGKTIADRIKGETGKARADLSPFQRGIQQSLTSAKTTATTGGQGVGAALSSGVVSGIATHAADAASASLVTNAIAAARHAARAQSPSKETEQLGLDLSHGLILGVKKGSAGVSKVLTDLSESVTRILGKQLAARQRTIRNNFKGKEEEKHLRALSKAWTQHSKTVTKAVADERKALQAVGKEQDALQSGNFLTYLQRSSGLYKRMAEAGVHNLDQAKSKLADLRQTAAGYAKSIRDSFVAFGDITQLGISEDLGGVDITALVDQLKTRAAQAERFAHLVKKLQAEGLNRTQIEQLTAAGVDGGLATAEAIQSAIDSGNTGIVNQLNRLGDKIKTAGTDLGGTLSTRYYRAGIKAAQGLVDGLNSKAKAIDRTAVRLANALVRAIKQALGIKSPSKVFQGIGSQINQGLALGIADTYASTAAGNLAGSVVSAFGNPGLSAQASSGSGVTKVAITLTAQQVSALERGRAIQLDLDAYQRAGGRRRL